MRYDQRVASYEYKNAYLYVILREMPEAGPKTYLCCTGIHITRFDPLCRGVAGICSNPAFKGLQLLRIDMSALALKKGLVPKPADHAACFAVTPPGEGWYRESLLLEKVTPRAARQLVEFGVRDLLTKVLTVCAPTVKLPKKMPTPPELQKFIHHLSTQRKA